jgi:uncharacterized protein YlxP (DUF503 family)
MVVLSAELRFHIPDAHSLKEKRMVCRSLIDGAKHKFNMAIAEVDTQDAHQMLTIGIAVVSGKHSHARDTLDTVILYLEEHAGAQLVEVERH